MIILSFVLTYGEVWKDLIHWISWRGDYNWTDALLMLFPLSAVVALTVSLARQKKYLESVTGGMPILAALSVFLVIGLDIEGIGMLIFNAYLLVLSVVRIVTGLKKESIAAMNGGMLTLGLLLMLRFVDADIECLAKGIIFILLGAGFLTVNLLMLKKKKAVSG